MSPTAQTILVNGGTRHIGSHTVVQLLDAADKVAKVIILDNLCNSKRGSVNLIGQIASEVLYVAIGEFCVGEAVAINGDSRPN